MVSITLLQHFPCFLELVFSLIFSDVLAQLNFQPPPIPGGKKVSLVRFGLLCTTSVYLCIVPLVGSTLITVGEYQKRLGGAEREFLHTSATTFLTPLRNFLEGDWRTISVSLTGLLAALRHCVCINCVKRSMLPKTLTDFN